MICPGCNKGEIHLEESIRGIFFKKHILTYFCPLCNWENIKTFSKTRSDIDYERIKQLNLPKKSEQIFRSVRDE